METQIKANDLVLFSGAHSRTKMARVIDVAGDDVLVRTKSGVMIVDIHDLAVARFVTKASERRTRRLLEGR